ncbi:MAG: hypothetical protein ACE5H0_08655 [Bacteroidota bacterium]
MRFLIQNFGTCYLREGLILGNQCNNINVDTTSSNTCVMLQSQLKIMRETRLSESQIQRILAENLKGLLGGKWFNILVYAMRQEQKSATYGEAAREAVTS